MIVGLDAASSRWHAVLCAQGQYTTEKCVATGHPDERRAQLVLGAERLFRRVAPCSLFIEEPLALSKNGKTTVMLGLAAGAIWAAALGSDVTTFWVSQSSWKKLLVPYPKRKEDIAVRFNERGIFYEDQDWYDARGLVEYGREQLGL